MSTPAAIEVRGVLASIQPEHREKNVHRELCDVLGELGFSDLVQSELALHLSDANKPHRRAVLAAILDLECMPTAELDLAVDTHCLGNAQLNFLARMFLGLD